MLTIWTDEHGLVRVDPGRLLRRVEACAAGRARWRVLCFVIVGCWLLTLSAGLWAAGEAERRQRAESLSIRTWLGEERARVRCLEALVHRAPPSQTDIVTVAGRAKWVAQCVKRELDRASFAATRRSD